MFCSELVRRRRRGYVNRSVRLSVGEVGLNLLGTTRTKRIGPRALRASFMGRQIAIFPLGIVACVPLAGAGRDVCHPARGWSVGRLLGQHTRPVAQDEWRQPALPALRGPTTGSAVGHRTGWNIRRTDRRCCHQN